MRGKEYNLEKLVDDETHPSGVLSAEQCVRKFSKLVHFCASWSVF